MNNDCKSDCRAFVAALFLLTSLAVSRAEEKFSFRNTPGKLPKDAIPRHYRLELTPSFDTGTTLGSELIELEVIKPMEQLVLNAVDIEFIKVEFAGSSVATLTPKEDKQQQTVTIPLSKPLPAGKHQLRIDFKGRISEKAEGLYFDRYQTATGEKRLLVTMMEPTDARRMFPCWDEPVFRATFQLTVTVPTNHTTVANMPVEKEEELPGGLKRVSFLSTPPMPAYLMVLASGEMEELRDEVAGIKLGIFTTEGKREQARYAMEATKQIVAFYNDYFGIKYALPKLDQIGVQNFAWGAMENWGGIVYREDALLFDPKKSTPDTRERIFGIIAHEVAHQWFGNLVTMAWWDNLWLNEGFASWMGTKATDHLNPSWQIWLRANSARDAAMKLDARRVTHKIQEPITNDSQATDAFDVITYQKGQSFLHMLESHLGAAAFRDGIRLYMQKHKFSNTTTADLWDALETTSGKPVKLLAASWTEQPGFPLVSVSANCTAGTLNLSMRQERFTLNFSETNRPLWQIPITAGPLSTSASEPLKFMLVVPEAKFPAGTCESLWKANIGNIGYFRVLYDSESFRKIEKAFPSLPLDEQLNLLSDTWALAEAGRSPISQYLSLVESVRTNSALPLWEHIGGTIGSIHNLQTGLPGAQGFAAYARWLLQAQFKRLGWDSTTGETHPDTLLRTEILQALCELRDEAVISEASKRFDRFLQNPDTLPGELRPAVIGTVGRYAGNATYDRLHALAKSAKDLEEKQLYYHAMAAALNPDLADRTLQLALTDELPPVYASRIVPQVAGVGHHAERSWNFAKEHMLALLDKVPFSHRNSYVPSIMSAFSDAARADELEDYTRKNLPPEALKKAEEIADGIRFRYTFKQREMQMIDKWVRNRKPSTTTP
ncbi:MAG: M1 family peptidase [Pedosphaera sp.]|nr:M1 family peptidase [Pedosphaera sp.]